MDKANQALTFLASGQIPQNSNAYSSLNEKKNGTKIFQKSKYYWFIISCNFRFHSILIQQ